MLSLHPIEKYESSNQAKIEENDNYHDCDDGRLRTADKVWVADIYNNKLSDKYVLRKWIFGVMRLLTQTARLSQDTHRMRQMTDSSFLFLVPLDHYQENVLYQVCSVDVVSLLGLRQP